MLVQEINLDGHWTVDQPGQTWTLTANSTIISGDDYGMEDARTGADLPYADFANIS